VLSKVDIADSEHTKDHDILKGEDQLKLCLFEMARCRVGESGLCGHLESGGLHSEQRWRLVVKVRKQLWHNSTISVMWNETCDWFTLNAFTRLVIDLKVINQQGRLESWKLYVNL